VSADLAGLSVALATPFLADGALDLPGFRRLVQHVRAGGADVLVALGSTGEGALLSEHERDAVITACREEAGPLPVVVGTGSSATAQAAAFTRSAQRLGAAAALVVVPPYVKATQAGIVAHFAAIAAAAPGLPLIAYNVPSRTGTNLLPATLLQLWQHPQVVAVKESSGNLEQIGQIAAELPRGKLLLAGDDALALPTLALGGHGLVSVLGNLLPQPMRQLLLAVREGQLQAARALAARLLPLITALALEPNPIPLKCGLSLLGIAGEHVRLPLLPAAPATRARLQQALRQAGASA